MHSSKRSRKATPVISGSSKTYASNVQIEESLAPTRKDTPSEKNSELALEANVPQEETTNENSPAVAGDIVKENSASALNQGCSGTSDMEDKPQGE